jgi:hypothetical protein
MYAINVDVNALSASNYTFRPVQGTLVVSAVLLATTAVNLSTTAGAPFNGTVATFTTPDQLDSATTFTAVITWGDGGTSNGVVTGSNGSFAVSGSHTFVAATGNAVSVRITNPNTQSATVSDSVTVTSPGQSVVKGLTLQVPPLLAFFDSLLGAIETLNANGTETVTDSLFGIPLVVALYDNSGNFLGATLLGINLPNWVWNL